MTQPTFASAKNARVIVGSYDLTEYFNSFDIDDRVEALKTTTFLQAAETYIQGLRDATVNLGGFMVGGAAGVTAAVNTMLNQTAGSPTIIAPFGLTYGNFAFGANEHPTDQKSTSPVAGTVDLSAQMQVTGGLDGGPVLMTGATISGPGADPSYVTRTGASAGGALAVLCVIAATGFTSATVKAEHSADHSSWGDLAVFSVTGVGGQVIWVPPAANSVKQYIRYNVSAMVGTSFAPVLIVCPR